MATRIDEDRSPESVTVVRGDTAMLVCTVINIGDKSVGITLFMELFLFFQESFRQKNVECMIQNGTQFIDRLKSFYFFISTNSWVPFERIPQLKIKHFLQENLE